MASAIDGTGLGILLSIAGLLLPGDGFAALGPWGRVFGGAIGILYFGICGSSLCGGQTVGKRLLGIAVLRADGSRLPMPAAFGRAAVLMLPVIFNNFSFQLGWILATIIAIIVFGLGGSILYLFLFNRPSRQATHDFAAGSIVTRVQNGRAEPVNRTFWRGHLVVFAVICAVSALGAGIVMLTMRNRVDIKALLTTEKHIETVAGTPAVEVFDGSTSRWGGSEETFVRASVMTYVERPDRERLANSIAATLLREVPSASSRSAISVTITSGYDIIFASTASTRTWTFTPAEWQDRIAGK